jgi:endo-1,4-beta-xylanase
MTNAIDTVANALAGIEQQVTELDMSVYNAGDRAANYGNNIPPAVLAEQGWLYKLYFDAFKEMSGKVSAVTIWGMADDDTWLDSFPVTRTDYPLPFDMKLQAKPAYWGIVDPTKLPGYGLTFSLASKASTSNTRILTVTATNGNVGPAYATMINGFTLKQTSGPACTPKMTAALGFPIALGDIAASGSASASFTVSIVGCNPHAEFTLSVPWSSAVYDTGTFVTNLDFNRGR